MMIKKHVLALCVVVGVSAFLGCRGVAQNSRSNWSVKDVTARFKSTIPGEEIQRLAEDKLRPGARVLEISGTFAATTEALSVVLGDVFLSPGRTPEREKERWLVESIGSNVGGRRDHKIVGPVRSGAVQVDFDPKFVESTSYLNGKAAVKWALGKETKSGPWQAKFYQNPTPLCMAFVVPESVPKNVTLHFGDVTVPVVVPPAK